MAEIRSRENEQKKWESISIRFINEQKPIYNADNGLQDTKRSRACIRKVQWPVVQENKPPINAVVAHGHFKEDHRQGSLLAKLVLAIKKSFDNDR